MAAIYRAGWYSRSAWLGSEHNAEHSGHLVVARQLRPLGFPIDHPE